MGKVEVVSNGSHALGNSAGLSTVTGLKAGVLSLAMERTIKCFTSPVKEIQV